MLRKPKFIRQCDSMQCGVASLAMATGFLGVPYGIDDLARICYVTREGVSMLTLSRAADRLGLKATTVKVTADRLRHLPMPAILHWNNNHFVLLYGITRKGNFRVVDPAKGHLTLTEAELLSHWLRGNIDAAESDGAKGIAMVLEATPEFGSKYPREPHKSMRKSAAFVAPYLREHRGLLFQIALGLLLACVLQLVMPFLTQAIVDRGIARKDISFIWLVMLGEVMIVAGRTVTDFLRRWLVLHISMRVNITMISDFFIKLLRLPMGFFDTMLTGDLLQRIGDHRRVQDFITSQFLGILFTLTSFVVFGVVLLVYDRLVFGIFLAGSLVYMAWALLFLRRRRTLDFEMFEKESLINGRTYQLVTSMQEIKLQNCEDRRRMEWEDLQADLFLVQAKVLRVQQIQEAGSVFINELKNVLVTVFVATAVISGEMTLGMMLAVQYIIGQLNSPLVQLVSSFYSMQDVKIALDRINSIHSRENERDSESAGVSQPEKGIVLRSVDFKYDPNSSAKILDDVSLQIKPDEVTAIVGASGSGKTTLMKLMLGFYSPLAGEMEIEGRSVTDMDLPAWRKRCGVVMQNGAVFSDTIARNVAIADDGPDPERLEEALRLANMLDFVNRLPLGVETVIGPDGLELSQGQKQRILIARAIYRDPEYIFLDEATNSLDSVNERGIVENMAEFGKGRTTVVIAHRLSTVSHADTIVVLEKGRVVETGNHAELIARRGAYYNLVKNQLELGD